MTALLMWTIYDHPADHPTAFVARKWRIERGGPVPTGTVLITPVLDDLRDVMMQMGLTCLTRMTDDDPKIVETWL